MSAIWWRGWYPWRTSRLPGCASRGPTTGGSRAYLPASLQSREASCWSGLACRVRSPDWKIHMQSACGRHLIGDGLMKMRQMVGAVGCQHVGAWIPQHPGYHLCRPRGKPSERGCHAAVPPDSGGPTGRVRVCGGSVPADGWCHSRSEWPGGAAPRGPSGGAITGQRAAAAPADSRSGEFFHGMVEELAALPDSLVSRRSLCDGSVRCPSNASCCDLSCRLCERHMGVRTVQGEWVGF